MPQEFQVLRCFACKTFQVQQVKKSQKWSCKMCGEKQTLKKVFGRGSGAECRQHVQKWNLMRGEIDENQATSVTMETAASQGTDLRDSLLVCASSLENECKDVVPGGDSRWQQFLEAEQQAEEDDQSASCSERGEYTTDRRQFEQTRKEQRQAYRNKYKEQRKQFASYPYNRRQSQSLNKQDGSFDNREHSVTMLTNIHGDNTYVGKSKQQSYQYCASKPMGEVCSSQSEERLSVDSVGYHGYSKLLGTREGRGGAEAGLHVCSPEPTSDMDSLKFKSIPSRLNNPDISGGISNDNLGESDTDKPLLDQGGIKLSSIDILSKRPTLGDLQSATPALPGVDALTSVSNKKKVKDSAPKVPLNSKWSKFMDESCGDDDDDDESSEDEATSSDFSSGQGFSSFAGIAKETGGFPSTCQISTAAMHSQTEFQELPTNQNNCNDLGPLCDEFHTEPSLNVLSEGNRPNADSHNNVVSSKQQAKAESNRKPFHHSAWSLDSKPASLLSFCVGGEDDLDAVLDDW